MKEWWSNPENRKKHRKATKEGMIRNNAKKKISKALKGRKRTEKECNDIKEGLNRYWSNPKNKKKHSERTKKGWENPERKRKQSEMMSIENKKRWKNPEFIIKQKIIRSSPNYKLKMSIAVKRGKKNE